jgi:DNA polymerase
MLGWDVCVIWEHELKDLEKLKKKLLDFHYNPSSYTVEITKIEKYSKKDKAYNIQTEKNHNYFAYGILVHNCIVDNKLYPKVKDLLWSCKIGSDIIRIKGNIPPSKMFVNLQEVEKYDDTKYSGSKCYKCPLAKNDFVPPFGSKTSSIMIIGEAPGKIEVERGQPFVGRSGSLLGDILAELGLDRSHLYISNSVFCHPVDGNKNRTPTDEEINCCRGHLEWEIDEIKPKVVITMGKVPLAAMLNKKVEEIKISKMVESVIDLETLSSKYKGVLLIPSYHPVAALYSPDSGYRDSIKNSIQLALDETNKQISKINRLKVSREKRENSGLIRSENNREN